MSAPSSVLLYSSILPSTGGDGAWQPAGEDVKDCHKPTIVINTHFLPLTLHASHSYRGTGASTVVGSDGE